MLGNHLYEAVSWLGRALSIAAEYKRQVVGRILMDIALVMKDMGEKEFTAAWQQSFAGQEPPLDALRKVLERQEGGTT